MLKKELEYNLIGIKAICQEIIDNPDDYKNYKGISLAKFLIENYIKEV
ncbi:MAG: hypothetical protein ACTSQJ_06045 [Promethearchaeota archaeon]